MKKQEIMISIGKDGNVQFEVKGVPGKDCLSLTQVLEEELGVVVDRQRTAEFYQEAVTEDVKVSVDND